MIGILLQKATNEEGGEKAFHCTLSTCLKYLLQPNSMLVSLGKDELLNVRSTIIHYYNHGTMKFVQPNHYLLWS